MIVTVNMAEAGMRIRSVLAATVSAPVEHSELAAAVLSTASVAEAFQLIMV